MDTAVRQFQYQYRWSAVWVSAAFAASCGYFAFAGWRLDFHGVNIPAETARWFYASFSLLLAVHVLHSLYGRWRVPLYVVTGPTSMLVPSAGREASHNEIDYRDVYLARIVTVKTAQTCERYLELVHSEGISRIDPMMLCSETAFGELCAALEEKIGPIQRIVDDRRQLKSLGLAACAFLVVGIVFTAIPAAALPEESLWPTRAFGVAIVLGALGLFWYTLSSRTRGQVAASARMVDEAKPR